MRFRKNLSVLLCILLSCLCFAGCNGVDDYPVSVGGTNITKQPQKVVAFSEQAASAIFALGYDSYLVGAPAEFLETEIAGITNIGYTRFVDFEIEIKQRDLDKLDYIIDKLGRNLNTAIEQIDALGQ